MMSWFNILKRNTAPDIRNEAQYNAASLEGRKSWHQNQSDAYAYRLKALQTQHSIELTDTENPVYQEMKQYQDLRNFHSRQAQRLRKCLASGKKECDDYYSLELEKDNRRPTRNRTFPSGQLDPYVELSLEAYNDLTNEQKARYHAGMAQYEDTNFHTRMYQRLHYKINLPTFPSPKFGGESIIGREYTKEEYLNMDKEKRRKYHAMMRGRFRKDGNIELSKWHNKMLGRLIRDKGSPTYHSPEHEQEEQ